MLYKPYVFLAMLVFVLHGGQMDASSVEAKVRKKRRRFDAEHAFGELQEMWAVNKRQPVSDDLNCDQAMDELLLRLPDLGSIFYGLLNGWYLGQWADYASCLQAAADSQYVLATVKGQYNGAIEFTRGGIGKYTDGFTTRMGLCFPKQCTLDEVRYFTEELIRGYAEGAGWTGVSVDYHAASQYDDEQTSN